MDWSQIVFLAAIPALILVTLTSLVLLLSTDWRISLLALTLQYVGVFFLVLQDWSFEMAATKLVAGWISAALLGMAINSLVEQLGTGSAEQGADDMVEHRAGSPPEQAGSPESTQQQALVQAAAKRTIPAGTRLTPAPDMPARVNPGGRIVALLTAMLIWLTVYTITPRILVIFPELGQLKAWAGLLLMGMGLIQLGFSNQAFRVIVGLLTFLSGFEIFYASIESSALVAGLLAGINLGVALIGAYLLLSPTMQEEQ